MRLRVDSSPSMWMVRGLRAILSITASAMAPLPSFACHADGANCERGMSDPVRSLGLMGSVDLRALVGWGFFGGSSLMVGGLCLMGFYLLRGRPRSSKRVLETRKQYS